METIILPNKVTILLDTLTFYGFESYVVGGCVRDMFLDRNPNDWDICTNALPEEVVSLFEKLDYRVIPTGLKHGTVTVLGIDDEHFEITTYRKDGDYSDGRRPDEVQFTLSIAEDLSRRDFTINAMAYSHIVGLIDPFDGVKDIERRKIVAVGKADDRFKEDALRMLRGIRFASQLNFEIEHKTIKSIKNNCSLIQNVSNERIRDELCKILISFYPTDGLTLLMLTDLLKLILPEYHACLGFEQHNPNHTQDVFDHTLSVIDNTPSNLKTRLAALFHDIAKPLTFSLDENGVGHFYNHHMVGMDMTREIMTRLKFENQMISDVCVLVKEHMSRHKNTSNTVAKKFINRVGVHNLNDLFDLMKADTLGSKAPYDYSDVDKLKELCDWTLSQKQPLSVKDLAINGGDLIQLGMKPSKRLGEILNSMLELVLEKPEMNSKELLINHYLLFRKSEVL